MKKFLVFLFPLLCVLTTFLACSKEQTLTPCVSELRSAIYYGQSQTLTVKAGYGFKEQPFVNDGKVGKTVSTLSFKLIDKEIDDVTYNLSFKYLNNEYKGTFSLNPLTDTLTCSVEIYDFTLNQFTINIAFGSNNEEITLKSIVPNGTLTYDQALNFLQKNQSALVSHYTNSEGVFNAEIYIRILVKDDKPYWYVGLASGNEQLKAFLIDGFSGEILAIREIF